MTQQRVETTFDRPEPRRLEPEWVRDQDAVYGIVGASAVVISDVKFASSGVYTQMQDVLTLTKRPVVPCKNHCKAKDAVDDQFDQASSLKI